MNDMETTNEKIPVPKKPLSASDIVVRLLCLFVVVAILVAALFPTSPNDPMKANLYAVSARGKDVFVAITGANSEREPLGLPPLWPTTYLVTTNHSGDISSKVFKTSSEYFYELYDGPNVGTDKHDPYVKGFDYSKLAGAGVPSKSGGGKVDAPNNMWIIAANITDQDDDRIPVLITRNVDVKEIERVVNHGLKASEFKIGIDLGKGQYKAPFSNKGFAAVFKGGTTLKLKKRTVTLGELFDNKELLPRDPSKPKIVYLMP
jgi:hypothetical protein